MASLAQGMAFWLKIWGINMIFQPLATARDRQSFRHASKQARKQAQDGRAQEALLFLDISLWLGTSSSSFVAMLPFSRGYCLVGEA